MWELIVDSARDGSINMAIDAALLDEIDKSAEPRTVVRFYTWLRPTISLGRNQKIEKAVDLEYCRANGIDVVHRPTGGRAVLHDDELTYAVISNDSSAFGDTIYGNYKRVSEALCLGYNNLGVPAVLAPDTRKPEMPAMFTRGGDPPCFVSPSRYELMVGGRKIVGSAQRRMARSVDMSSPSTPAARLSTISRSGRNAIAVRSRMSLRVWRTSGAQSRRNWGS